MNDITTAISRKIRYGKDLTLLDMKVILSVLHGNNDYNSLSKIHSGEVRSYHISKNVEKYIVKQEPQRPSKSNTDTRNMFIAHDYGKLINNMKRDEVLSKLANESIERYGSTINVDRIADCITSGKKLLKLLIEMHNTSEEGVIQTIIDYINNNPDVAKSKQTLFEFITEEY